MPIEAAGKRTRIQESWPSFAHMTGIALKPFFPALVVFIAGEMTRVGFELPAA